MSKEFVMGARISLADDFSNPMRDVLNETNKFRDAVNGFETEAPAMIDKLHDMGNEHKQVAQTANQAATAVDNLASDTDKASSSMSKAHKQTKSFTSGMSSLKSAVVGAVTAVASMSIINKAMNMVTGAIDTAIKRVDTLAKFPGVMEKMGFSTDLAEKSINKLSEGIQGLPTTLDGIVGSAQSIALMTGDLDKASDTALTLNNALLASGSDAVEAERGMTQYTKMLATGKVEMQSWQTLQETMGFALTETAKSFGFAGKTAQSDLYRALQKGYLTMDEFNDRLIKLNGGAGGFAEIAKESSGGIATAFSNMRTAVARGVAGIITSMQEFLAKTPLKSIENIAGLIGKGFSTALGYVAESIKKIDVETLMSKIGMVTAFIGTLYDSIMSLVYDTGEVSDLWQKLGVPPDIADNIAVFADLLREGVVTAIDVAKAAFEGFKDVLGFLRDNMDTIIPIMGGLVAGFVAFKVITSTIAMFKAVRAAMIGYKAAVVGSTLVTKGFNAALRANPVGFIVTAIGLLVAAGIYLWKNWDEVVAWIKTAWSGVQMFFAVVWETIKQIFMNFATSIGNHVMLFIAGIKAVIAAGLAYISDIWSTIWGYLQGPVEFFVGYVQLAIDNFLAIVQGIFTAGMAIIHGDWGAAWDAIKGIGEDILNNILGFFEGFDLFEVGKNIIQGLIDGIGNMKNAVVDKVKNIASSIWDGVTGFFGIASPSKLMRFDAGQQLGAGLRLGMEDSHRGLAAAATDMAEAAMISPRSAQEMQAVQRVSTVFDGYNQPTYAGTANVPASGSYAGKGSGKGDTFIEKLVEKIELVATADTNAQELLEQFLHLLYEKLKNADEILSGGDKGVLL